MSLFEPVEAERRAQRPGIQTIKVAKTKRFMGAVYRNLKQFSRRNAVAGQTRGVPDYRHFPSPFGR